MTTRILNLATLLLLGAFVFIIIIFKQNDQSLRCVKNIEHRKYYLNPLLIIYAKTLF